MPLFNSGDKVNAWITLWIGLCIGFVLGAAWSGLTKKNQTYEERLKNMRKK